jgi:hypothetical protein
MRRRSYLFELEVQYSDYDDVNANEFLLNSGALFFIQGLR